MVNSVNVYGIAVAPVNFRRPAALFNGKVAPLQPMAARGVIWYQGEGNPRKWLASGHAETLTALITSWRTGFEQLELPFTALCSPPVGRHPVLETTASSREPRDQCPGGRQNRYPSDFLENQNP